MKNTTIAVIGDYILDHYYFGESNRLSPEAPIPVVTVNDESFILGGAGNVVRNLKAFDVDVLAFSVIGKDFNGEIILDLMSKIGVSTDNIVLDETRPTTTKSRVQVNSQQIVRIDKEVTEDVILGIQNILFEKLSNKISKIDLLIISDYGKGLLNPIFLKKILTLFNQNKIKVLVDPKGKDFSKYQGAYVLTPNKSEASIATGIDICDDESLSKALIRLKDITSSQEQLITLGPEGIAYISNELIKIPALASEVYDVTGAGDTVIASLGFQLATGATFRESVDFANKAASIVVQKRGSAVASLSEIQDLSKKSNLDYKIINNSEFIPKELIDTPRNKKIVFTNGCFDILHAGHVNYLIDASRLGDILVVGLNTDSSVRNLKGNSRPINEQYDRAMVLAALECVDFVILFDEDTPLDLIKTLKPDILVKGGDYRKENVIGNEFVAETRILKFVDGKSTTTLIDRIKKNN